MADKKVQSKELELTNDKKSDTKVKTPWSVKKVLTTIIIVILSLLMIGGAYYIVVLIKDANDDTYVFGTYNGEEIKYEVGNEFYYQLMNDSSYQEAAESGDYNTIFSSWQTAFQYQVLTTAGNQIAAEAKIPTTKNLVNDLIIESGVYASEDGSVTFDAEVYNGVSESVRSSYFDYMYDRYPYSVVISDISSVQTSDAESDFIVNLSTDTRDFEYFVIDYNAVPDSFANSYDISEMTLTQDENGNNVEPTLEEIKAYIFEKEPETVEAYIEDVYTNAMKKASFSFEYAASSGNGLVSVNGAMNNVGLSSFYVNGIENVDYNGALASVFDEEIAKELYSAEVGDLFSYETDDGYVVVRVASTDSDDTYLSYNTLMFNAYSSYIPFYDFANSVMTSDKLEDNFYTKFLSILFGSMS